MNITSDSTILEFTAASNSGRTAVILVTARHNGAQIGVIQWDIKWRQYALVPAIGVRLTHRVLLDISKVLVMMMDAWAVEKGLAPRGDNPKFNEGLKTPEASDKRRKKRETSVPWK